MEKLSLTSELHFEGYKNLAVMTESVKDYLVNDVKELGLNARILHSIIGASTELDEYLKAIENNDRINALEELGDMLWYAAILHDEVNFNLPVEEVNEFPSYALDLVKKTLFYGKELSRDDAKRFGTELVGFAVTKIRFLGGDEEVVMDTNIRKLKARYGDKFSEERSIVRNLEKEREILEEGM